MAKEVLPHILLVEDEQTLGTLLKETLKLNGYTSKYCKDGEEGWQVFQKERFDLCIFDVNMPKKNGFELARLVREINLSTPILFLTANSSEEDKLKGFEIGADEYITKPFSTQELMARIKAILRRVQAAQHDQLAREESYEIGGMVVDIPNHFVEFKGSQKKISNTEAELIKLFVKNKNQLITRNTLLLNVWGRDDFYTARNLDVYINKLRKLIKENPSLEIVNIHGSGFKLVEKAETL
ncbi:MAG: response regulator transcription factor [Bacteroidetes bacterium]|nr:response regulator transcription factor [Bacteroidota bacterium]